MALAVSALCLSLAAPNAMAQLVETVTNGNFAAGNSGFTTDYTAIALTNPPPATRPLDGAAGEGKYGVGDNPRLGHPRFIQSLAPYPGGATQAMIVNGSTGTHLITWQQQVNLVAGVTYQFSGWVTDVLYTTPTFVPKPAYANMEVELSNAPATCGAGVGPTTSLTTMSTIALVAAAGTPNFDANVPPNWVHGTGSVTPTQTGSYCLQVRNLNTSSGGNDFAMTGLSLTGMLTPPVIVDDSFTTPVNTPLTGQTVATNDPTLPTTPDFSVVTGATNGTVTLNPDGTFVYTPNPGFTGTDTFTYQVCSGPGNAAPCSPPATVTVTVTPGPVAANDNYTTPVNTPVNNTVASNDGPLPATPDFSVVGQPTNGTVAMNPDGTFTYTPNTGFVGTDTFTYQVCSGPGNTAPCSPPATVTIQVGVALTQPVPSLGLLGLLGLGAALAGLGVRRRKQM